MPKIKILVVDDSAVFRELLARELEKDLDFEVMGRAADPIIAKKLIAASRPDVVTLDVEMPRQDGLSFLSELMASNPLPVVMISSLTDEGCAATLRAFELGAVDAIAKPRDGDLSELGKRVRDAVRAAAHARPRAGRSAPVGQGPTPPHGLGSPSAGGHGASAQGTPPHGTPSHGPAPGSVHGTTDTLPDRHGSGRHPAIPAERQPSDRLLPPPDARGAGHAAPGHASPGQAAPVYTPASSDRHGTGVHSPVKTSFLLSPAQVQGRLVAIGASTGGTEALKEVLGRLPRTFPPVVIVQHMPDAFTGGFARSLAQHSKLEVIEAQAEDVELRPGLCVLARGGFHLLVAHEGGRLVAQVRDGPPVRNHRPSVDVLFTSVAKAVGGRALGVILTGMGDDGARGLLKLKESGARTFAQDAASCVVYGMPRRAVEVGAVEKQVELERIGDELVRALVR